MELWAAWSSGRCPCSWWGGWNLMIFKVLSNLNYSMILSFYYSVILFYCVALTFLLGSTVGNSHLPRCCSFSIFRSQKGISFQNREKELTGFALSTHQFPVATWKFPGNGKGSIPSFCMSSLRKKNTFEESWNCDPVHFIAFANSLPSVMN